MAGKMEKATVKEKEQSLGRGSIASNFYVGYGYFENFQFCNVAKFCKCHLTTKVKYKIDSNKISVDAVHKGKTLLTLTDKEHI